MAKTKDCVLGIDTSNYKTSVAIVDNDSNIICDFRKLLRVKQGERGLRQSDALFQHVENLPDMIEKALTVSDILQRIGAVACSNKPRPVDGSYMPVFKAGMGFGKAIAAALQVPYFEFSHQEGHIQAIKSFSDFKDKSEFLCYHLSGGTCELLKVSDKEIKILGGSKDISFGQVIDRVGVKLGMQFPAGEEMDSLALSGSTAPKVLKKISRDGLFFNLSGIETQCSRQAETLVNGEASKKELESLIKELFDKIAKILIEITEAAIDETSIKSIMFTGGVSSSRYISSKLKSCLSQKNGIEIEFGMQNLSQDNGVGIALLGGRQLWL